MDHKISVTVQIDMDGKNIRIITAGCLTRFSQSALLPLIRRARKLTPGIHVTVDATPTRHVDAAGLELLRDAVDNEVSLGNGPPVQFVVPAHLPRHHATVDIGASSTYTSLVAAPHEEGAS